MGRIRYLKPEFWTNEHLVALPFEARLLFQGLWNFADRDGRLEDRPVRLRMQIFPADNVDVDHLLQLLADSPGELLLRYEVDGKRYLQILSWHKHQKPHPKETPSLIPLPESSEKVRPSRGKKRPSREKVDTSREKVSTSKVGMGTLMGMGNGEPPPEDPPPQEDKPPSDVWREDAPTPRPAQPSSAADHPERDPPGNKSNGMHPPDSIRKVFEHWQRHDALTHHRTLSAEAKRHISARLKDGYTVEDLCRSISRYAELCTQARAPGYNAWSLAELMGRGAGNWIDKLLDPKWQGILPERGPMTLGEKNRLAVQAVLDADRRRGEHDDGQGESADPGFDFSHGGTVWAQP